MLEAILDTGMGDSLHARSFLIEYCKQKNINHKDIIIYPGRHAVFFENDGFTLKTDSKPTTGFFRYDNIGQLNITKKFEDFTNSAKTVAVNAGIAFTFNVVSPLKWNKTDISNLDLPERFITVNYGYDDVISPNRLCSKAWPLEYWNLLVSKIKIPCVQIGGGKHCKLIRGVKRNFVNKLSIKESAEIMKRGLFHVDIEGGLVILNHHLGCKSVALFGPTAVKSFGIAGNLNLWHTKCAESPCNPKNINKVYRSIYRDKNHPGCTLRCMRDLTPDYVITQIHEHKWL